MLQESKLLEIVCCSMLLVFRYFILLFTLLLLTLSHVRLFHLVLLRVPFLTVQKARPYL